MYGSLTLSNVIPVQRDENRSFHAISYCMYNTKNKNSEIRLNTVNKIINEWEYYKFFIMMIYQWLIELKITKIYFPEMGNIVEVSNLHASSAYFLIICSECIMKIPPIPLIMVVDITYFVMRFVLLHTMHRLCILGKLKIYLENSWIILFLFFLAKS